MQPVVRNKSASRYELAWLVSMLGLLWAALDYNHEGMLIFLASVNALIFMAACAAFYESGYERGRRDS